MNVSASCRLTRNERLRHARDFKAIFDNVDTVTFSAGVYRVIARKNGMPFSRLGVGVKRALLHAPGRNREKRRVKEIYRAHKHAIALGYDIVVIVRMAKALSFAQRTEQLVPLLLQIGKKPL